jgi:putative membrane protein
MFYIVKQICMKKISWLCLALQCSLLACNNTAKDSVAKADSINEAKRDTTNRNDSLRNGSRPALGVSESTADFLVKVADVSKTEVAAGQLAEQKASSRRVKAFAMMMVRDHSKANAELKDLAAKKNVTLPTRIGEDHQKKMDELKGKTGKDFDKDYMDMMEDGHESTVRDFENHQDASDADVKAFVNKTLPTLRMHLDSAKAIKSAINH